MAVHSKPTIVSSWIPNEIPTGTINGINKDFELAYNPATEVIVRLTGSVIVPGISKDYTISGKVITFIKAPKIGMEVVVSYFRV